MSVKLKTSLKWLALSLTVLLVIAAISAYFFMRRSLPPMDGQLSLAGLSQSVKIQRDTYGIPHIFAANKMDALKALGFTIASERLFQMEMQRRLVYGTLSEVVGPVALNSDKLYRTLMIPKAVDEMIAHQKSVGQFEQIVWDELEAYYSGVNEFIKTRPLPYEFAILGFKPQEFSAKDAYVMTGYMAYSFGIATKADVLMSSLAEKLSEDLLQDLRNMPLEGKIKTAMVDTMKDLSPLSENSFATIFDGSNGWLIGPSHSASGKSILANDPHIGFALPGVWYEAHIKTPEYEFYGHHLPLIPYAILGHGPRHGWGFTMSETDDMDLYQEDVDASSFTYTFKGKKQALEVWKEEIPIKGQSPYVIEIKRSQHGPLMDEVLDKKGLALKWAFHSNHNDTLRALYHMTEAKDMASFKKALDHATAPGLNVMYADAENIAWWMFGEVSVKANPNSDFILNGSSGEDEYIRVLSPEEKPHIENPPEGLIITANSKPVGMPDNIRGDWQAPSRKNTIAFLLGQKDKWSAEELQKIQTANFSTETSVILDLLMKDLQLSDMERSSYSDVLQALKDWDFHSEIDSIGASIYHQWNNEVLDLLLEDWTEQEKAAYLNLPYAWVFYERVLHNPQSAWWKKTPRKELISEAFRNTVSKLTELTGANVSNWKWGRIHKIEYIHPLGRSAPLNLFFNLGPYGIPGAYNEINNNKARMLGRDFKVVAGPSTRRIVDFANTASSYGILPLGNSGHILSPFYKDQRKMFIRGQYRPQLMNETLIEQAKTHELVLTP